jgi:ribosome-binding factor A
MKDPRLSTMVSVTKADTTRDLSYCKIYVSVLGNDKQKDEALTGLKNAAGFIRGVIAREINLRNTPELMFVLDDSLEYSAKMMKLINEADKGNEE